jgi:hypothetical protein
MVADHDFDRIALPGLDRDVAVPVLQMERSAWATSKLCSNRLSMGLACTLPADRSRIRVIAVETLADIVVASFSRDLASAMIKQIR